MQNPSPYLDELYQNIDSPVAILEFWDFAMEEWKANPNDASLNWIIAFDELFRWEKTSDTAGAKVYYENLDPKRALITLKFLEILEFIEIIPAYYKGINHADNPEIMVEIDTWIEENDTIYQAVIIQLLLAQKEWFYSRNKV